MTTPEQWMNQFVGKSVDGGQCVGWASTFYKQYLGWPNIWGNAVDIFKNAPDSVCTKILNNPQDYSQHPEEGDIIIWNAWNGNPYGHIAVCSWTSNGSNFVSYDQNWPGGSVVHRQTHDYGNVKGWLRPKNRFWLVDPQIAINAAAEAARKAEEQRLAAEKAVAEAKAIADKLEAERLAKEEAARVELENAQAKIEAEAKLEAERIEKERLDALKEEADKEVKIGEDMKIKDRIKSPVVLTAVLAQILLVVALFMPEISETVKIVGTVVIQSLTLLGILNNPTDTNSF